MSHCVWLELLWAKKKTANHLCNAKTMSDQIKKVAGVRVTVLAQERGKRYGQGTHGGGREPMRK